MLPPAASRADFTLWYFELADWAESSVLEREEFLLLLFFTSHSLPFYLCCLRCWLTFRQPFLQLLGLSLCIHPRNTLGAQRGSLEPDDELIQVSCWEVYRCNESWDRLYLLFTPLAREGTTTASPVTFDFHDHAG